LSWITDDLRPEEMERRTKDELGRQPVARSRRV